MVKELIEKRNDLLDERDALMAKAREEKRGFEDAERERLEAIVNEVKNIDKDITLCEETREWNKIEAKVEERENESVEDIEERMFCEWIRGEVNNIRSGEQNFSVGNNGKIIPVHIANKIINTVKEMSPILQRATVFYTNGKLQIPVYGNANSTHNITVGYGTEFTDLVADAGAFTSVDLTGYLVGALTKIGISLINNTDINLVGFVVAEIARRVNFFLEGEFIKGAGSGSSNMQGITVGCTNTLTTAGATAITIPELIELQAKVIQIYQPDACWIMSRNTFTYIKELKDSNNRYYLQYDLTEAFPYRLLGKPVFISDNMDDIAATNKTVIYGDLSGFAVKITQSVEMNILREVYSNQHAIGINVWLEMDSAVIDNQKLAVLVQKAS